MSKFLDKGDYLLYVENPDDWWEMDLKRKIIRHYSSVGAHENYHHGASEPSTATPEGRCRSCNAVLPEHIHNQMLLRTLE